MRRIAQKMLLIFLTVAFLAGVSGCSTMKGLGQDIKKGGQSLENSAERHGG